jgi:hypothetical protein
VKSIKGVNFVISHKKLTKILEMPRSASGVDLTIINMREGGSFSRMERNGDNLNFGRWTAE